MIEVFMCRSCPSHPLKRGNDMVKILVDGEISNKQRVFSCERCGCVFKTDTYSRDFSNIEADVVTYISNCPQCFSDSKEIKENY